MNIRHFLSLILKFPSPKYYSLNLQQSFQVKTVIEMTILGERECESSSQLNIVWVLSFMLSFLIYKDKFVEKPVCEKSPWRTEK